MRVRLELPTKQRQDQFLAGVRRSRKLHRNLVTPPNTAAKLDHYIKLNRRADCFHSFVILRETDDIVGVINVSSIKMANFKSAFVGYYGLAPHAGKGLMREGMSAVLDHVFLRLKLHRLEANIQPTNERSIALVRGLGFRLEGYSPRYLKICGRWRDHERWAMIVDDWKESRGARGLR